MSKAGSRQKITAIYWNIDNIKSSKAKDIYLLSLAHRNAINNINDILHPLINELDDLMLNYNILYKTILIYFLNRKTDFQLNMDPMFVMFQWPWLM